MKKDDRFDALLIRYAALILSVGVGLKKGDYLLVSALVVHRELALAIAGEAYRRGASYVNILFQDEKLQKAQLEFADEGSLSFIPDSMLKAYEEVLAKKGAFVSISGCEDLDIFRGIDPERYGKAFLARAAKLDFFNRKIRSHAIRWCVAASATPGRAAVIFPGSSPETAEQMLWEKIFEICGVCDSDPQDNNPEAGWEKRIALLETRKKILNESRIGKIWCTSPTCELSFDLDQRARWVGGFSVTPAGERFLPNIPTEEVFTAPRWQSVNGFFTATRPLTYKNIHIEKLTIFFRDGEIASLEGNEGIRELREILSTDHTYRRLGEVALVDSRSHVSRSGLVFYDLLYDENAECHAALGAAYDECLEGAGKLSTVERERAGFNESSLHIDVMFGSSELSVTALCGDETKKKIMDHGVFLI